MIPLMSSRKREKDCLEPDIHIIQHAKSWEYVFFLLVRVERNEAHILTTYDTIL